MEPDFLNAFAQSTAFNQLPFENDIVQGEKKKVIKPTSRNDPKLEGLQVLLIDWINSILKQEHIIIKSLEEDLFDGLILHHLLEKLGSLNLDVEKIALTENKQRQKLTVILEAVTKCLQVEESQLKWSIDSILKKDLLSTLHLLIAIAKHFQPDLAIPPNINVEVVIIERTAKGLKTENAVEYITDCKETLEDQSNTDAFDELFTHAPDKLEAVKEVFLQFVNKHVGKLGLNVKDFENQFADGVILLLLIGQLQGFFLNLRDFFLNPSSETEMLHNVNLVMDLLTDEGVLNVHLNPEDIMCRDVKTILKILYCLYSKYKTKKRED
ncbi:gamma-parvin [Alligator mississippiensis]|nr:gamma-parvin [Alligator mississippiensis]XP_019348706.1 gamma-parvin [Alligator mississippiensis]